MFHVGYGDIDESWLIAADPPGSWCNSSLGAGKTFTDQATGATVEVLSKTPQEITVSVQLGTPVTLPPIVTPSGSPNNSPQPCSESNAPYSIYTPPGYAFIPRCFSQCKTIYSDDLRFTFFNTRSLFADMHYIQTGNVREKDDRDLSWSINLKSPATVFIFYRKIPGQAAPAWITQNYEKRTPNSFEDVSQFRPQIVRPLRILCI